MKKINYIKKVTGFTAAFCLILAYGYIGALERELVNSIWPFIASFIIGFSNCLIYFKTKKF